MQIEITIAIPIYDVADYIEDCLLSALNQDFSSSYEILLIDDRGIDNSMERVNNIISCHCRGNIIRIIQHDFNKGLGAARNTAIENARGKYLFFLDGDDTISTNCLSLLYKEALKTKSQIAVGSVQRILEEDGSLLQELVYERISSNHPAAMYDLMIKGYKPHIEVWNKLYETSFLRENNIHCYNRIFEDILFDVEAYAHASSVCFIPDITLRYIIRPKSIVSEAKKKDKIEQTLIVRIDVIKKFQEFLQGKYRHIKGIYDFYFSILFITFYSISGLEISEEQKTFFSEKTKGFTKVVPNIFYIHSPLYRRIYRVCKFHDNYEGFMEAWRLQEMSAFEQLCWYPILIKLHKIKKAIFFRGTNHFIIY